MVRVRILEARAGHADERYHLPDNFSFQPGAIEEFDDELAEAWIAAGIVEAVEDDAGEADNDSAKSEPEPAKHEAHGKHAAKPEPKAEPKKPVIRAHSHLRGSSGKGR